MFYTNWFKRELISPFLENWTFSKHRLDIPWQNGPNPSNQWIFWCCSLLPQYQRRYIYVALSLVPPTTLTMTQKKTWNLTVLVPVAHCLPWTSMTLWQQVLPVKPLLSMPSPRQPQLLVCSLRLLLCSPTIHFHARFQLRLGPGNALCQQSHLMKPINPFSFCQLIPHLPQFHHLSHLSAQPSVAVTQAASLSLLQAVATRIPLPLHFMLLTPPSGTLVTHFPTISSIPWEAFSLLSPSFTALLDYLVNTSDLWLCT